ncbi:MAG: NAD(P)/FAD-dependent oxidoreductase [Candidatus Aenigmarchaeota archaeon]|nr:NAD(P)/FAD-dependent oxidoreductase [Candidatus Aenigmarchaeota archaeon]
MRDNYDVIVAGCGPAGSSVAKTCADLGLDVVVLDRSNEIGTPKRCGEGLSANSVKRLGFKIPAKCIAQKIHGAFVYAPNGKNIEIKFKGTEGFILERKVFDKWLAAEAASAGASIYSKARISDLIKGSAAMKKSDSITEQIFSDNYVCGVDVETSEGKFKIYGKIVVASDGVESMLLRKAGIKSSKSPKLVDSGFQYEMAGIQLCDPHMIELFFGNQIAKRGYCWIFPKGKDTANVGVGISGAGQGKTAKDYLDDFIDSRPELRNGSILEVNGGSIPVGGFMKNMVADGIIGVGDSVNQVNPIHGGGIAESITAGRIASRVIKSAVDEGDYSAKFLDKYNKVWWKERGNSLQKVEKVREVMENLNDDQMNDLVDILSGEDLMGLAHGSRLPKLLKIAAKMKIRGFTRMIGI